MRDKDITEGLGDLAHAAEKDHEVQMARAELYKLAKYAIKLHDMLKGISEAEGLEGWVQSKITKSADMIGSVYHHLDYQESPMAEARDTHCSDKCCGSDVKAEDCTCSPDCKHCNCNAVTEAAEEKASCGCDSGCSHCGGKHTMNEVGKKCSCCDNVIKAVTAEGKFKSAAHRKAVHAAKASGKKKKKGLGERLAAKLEQKKRLTKEV